MRSHPWRSVFKPESKGTNQEGDFIQVPPSRILHPVLDTMAEGREKCQKLSFGTED